jgi:hypothetical protein
VATAEKVLRLAEATRPALGLVNVNLKDGGDGVELARMPLTRYRTPCPFVSGHVEDAHAARNAARGYIAKPYEPAIKLMSAEVARAIIDGHRSAQVPHGPELFRDTAPGPRTTATV